METARGPKPADVLLRDGTIAVVRRATVADLGALERLHAEVSDDSLRLRFFSSSRHEFASAARVALQHGDDDLVFEGESGRRHEDEHPHETLAGFEALLARYPDVKTEVVVRHARAADALVHRLVWEAKGAWRAGIVEKNPGP